MSGAEVISLADRAGFSPVAGVVGTPVFGERAMLSVVQFEPDTVTPRHRHPQEQLGVVIEGSVTLEVDGTRHELGPMQAYFIPSDVEHGVDSGTRGAKVIEVFHPLRSDYLDAAAGRTPVPLV